VTIRAEVLLDTHVLVWLRQNRGRLSSRQHEVLAELDRRGGTVAISAITLWEIAMLSAKKRIEFPRPLPDVLREIEEAAWLEVLPINAAVATESVSLDPDLHADPADRIIVATARAYGLPLMTSDEKIRVSALTRVI